MNIILYLTALHIAQSGTGSLPWSGKHPLPCRLSLPYMSAGLTSLPSFYMNVLYTGLCCYRVFRGAAALSLPLSSPLCRRHECTKIDLIRCLFVCLFVSTFQLRLLGSSDYVPWLAQLRIPLNE